MQPFYPASPAITAPGCLNCGRPRYGDYCHMCGQNYLEGRLSVGGILKEFVAKALSLENGLLHTFVELSLRPGWMISEYVRGRRRCFTHPVGYLLLSAALWAAVWPLRAQSFRADVARATVGDDAIFQRAYIEVITAFQVHPVVSVLLVCCLFVPLQRVFFWGRITFAESFVYALFVFGHAIMLEGLLTPVVVLASANASHVLDKASAIILLYLVLTAAPGYFGWRGSTFLRTGVVIASAFLGLLFMMVMMMIVVYVGLLIGQGAIGQ